jgi:hypothetical protein
MRADDAARNITDWKDCDYWSSLHLQKCCGLRNAKAQCGFGNSEAESLSEKTTCVCKSHIRKIGPIANPLPSAKPAGGSPQDGRSAPKGRQSKAQGWPRFLRPTLGKDAIVLSTLKGLSPDATLSG